MRVPKRYAAVEPRWQIHRSLRTDSERESRSLLPAGQAAIIAELDTLKSEDGPAVAKAIFGGVDVTQLMLSELVAEVEDIGAYENR